MSNFLISICIPVYNGKQYIDKCIDSCLAQTYQNFELIICDDCSTDGTVDYIKSKFNGNEKIKLFQNSKNLGLVGNWNETLSHANGEYIKWLFQDDWIEQNALEEFVNCA